MLLPRRVGGGNRGFQRPRCRAGRHNPVSGEPPSLCAVGDPAREEASLRFVAREAERRLEVRARDAAPAAAKLELAERRSVEWIVARRSTLGDRARSPRGRCSGPSRCAIAIARFSATTGEGADLHEHVVEPTRSRPSACPRRDRARRVQPGDGGLEVVLGDARSRWPRARAARAPRRSAWHPSASDPDRQSAIELAQLVDAPRQARRVEVHERGERVRWPDVAAGAWSTSRRTSRIASRQSSARMTASSHAPWYPSLNSR